MSVHLELSRLYHRHRQQPRGIAAHYQLLILTRSNQLLTFPRLDNKTA